MKGTIENKARNNNGQIKVTALEMKADFGKTQVSFVINANANGAGSANFLVVSRFKSPG